MELRDYLDILRRRWLSVVIVALATLAVAGGVTLLMTPQYTATTRLFFAVQGGDSVTDLAQGSTYAEKQMTSYAEVATSPLVLNPVVDKLDLTVSPGELADSVTATVPPDTVILEISATDVDAPTAAKIANAIGAEVSKAAGGLSPDQPNGSEAVRATTLASAQIPTSQSSPNVLRNLALGLVLGLLLGVGIAILRNVLDTKVRSEQDVRALTDSPILGAIAFDETVHDHPLIIRSDPLGAPSEAVRRLRTNLQFIDVADRPKSIVVTSSVPGEGKTTTAINLSVALADAGSRVLLIDADLRRPSVAEYLGMEGGVGLTTVLIGRADIEDVVQPWQDSSLDILAAGQVPPNPSELLGSAAMGSLLKQLSGSYDTILLDSAPLLPVTDAAVLSKLAGGALLIAGADRIHRPQLRDAIDSLETAGAHLFGLVLNKVARRDARAYVYNAGYAPVSEVATTELGETPKPQMVRTQTDDAERSPESERIRG